MGTSLIRWLTALVAVLASFGVLNSMLMLTRERVHDLGVFKAAGAKTRPRRLVLKGWSLSRSRPRAWLEAVSGALGWPVRRL